MEKMNHSLRSLLPSFGMGPTQSSSMAKDSLLAEPSFAIAPTPKMADSVLAESMNQMSLQEREKVYEDIHGVAQQWIPEEPTFVTSCLAELQTELNAIPTHLKHAYDLAYSQNATYVTSRKFRLLFLRSESFQPKAAAHKMVGFLEAKLELFGADKLSRDIVLSDYDTADVKCLESGLYQLLPGRDRLGRPVLFCANGVAPPNATANNKIRTVWYMAMAALEDEDTQRGGIVSVNFNVGNHHGLDREFVWKTCKLVNQLPFKIVAMHFCYNDPKLDLMIALGTYVLEGRTRTRLRAHSGSEMECIYHLNSFGITKDILPLSTSGKVKRDNHKLFMQRRQARDATWLATLTRKSTTTDDTEQDEERVVVPRPLDVLQGRGRHFIYHPGNVRLQSIINDYAEDYERAGIYEKTVLAEKVVGLIQNPEQDEGMSTTTTTSTTSSSSTTSPWAGGRFLIQDDMGWKVVDDGTARGRVSHKFRNLRLRPSNPPPSTSSNNSYDSGSHDSNHKNPKPKRSTTTRKKKTTPSTLLAMKEEEETMSVIPRMDGGLVLLDEDGFFGCFAACKRQKLQ